MSICVCGAHTRARKENVATSKHATRKHTHIRTQGTIDAVVTAMGRLAENAKLQENACEALGNPALTHPRLDPSSEHPKNQVKIGAQVENIHEYI
jgi:hypothetical protein